MREAVRAAAAPLDPECERAVAALREKCPDAFPSGPLKPGQPAPPVALALETAQALYGATFAAAAGPSEARAAGAVIWTRSDAELLVGLEKIRVRCLDGLVLVGIPVYCEQTQDAEVVVAFAVGAPEAPAGMVIATESVPRGPDVIVDRWGDALVGAAHQALVALAQSIAGAAGTEVDGLTLLPAALPRGTGDHPAGPPRLRPPGAAVSIAADGLGELLDLAKALGIADAGDEINGDWFADPGHYVGRMLRDPGQRDALLRALEALLAQERPVATDAEGRQWGCPSWPRTA